MAKRIGMVASTCCWVADGGAVLLGNVIRDFHGGAVFSGNGIAGFFGGPNFRESHCKWSNVLEWWLPRGAECARCYEGMAFQVSMVARCY